MADNSSLPVASGNETFANNDIGGVKYPRVKVTWGPAGTSNDADIATGKPMPVQLRGSDGTDRSNALPVTLGSTTITGTVAVTQSGTWNISPAAVTPVVSAVAESSHIIKASAGTLFDWHVTTGAIAGYIMIFNAASAPADGAVAPIVCIAIAANTTFFGNDRVPTAFSTGITMVFSTTGPFTKTASATAFFSGKAT